MRIAFMGTPAFAVPTLKALSDKGHEIIAVYTQPDKPRNRGMKESFSPVKEEAVKLGLTVRQPIKLRENEEELSFFKNLKLDVAIVVAYGQLLPSSFLEAPTYGCINGHASLLPKFRGAAPIQWAIYNGDLKTGVTAMQMSVGMDEGDILYSKEFSISDTITGGELTEELSILCAETIVETLDQLALKGLQSIKQEETNIPPTYAPKIQKEMANLDFSKSAMELHNQIRAFQPWPGARVQFRDKWLKILKTSVINENAQVENGTILPSSQLKVACSEGTLVLEEVQMEGKKQVSGEDFVRGYQPKANELIQ